MEFLAEKSLKKIHACPVEFGSKAGITLRTISRGSRKGSVESQEMRAPSLLTPQHSEGKDLVLLTAQVANGIPECNESRV